MSRNTRILLWIVGPAIAVILVLVFLGSVTTYS
jgi:TRAP-type C4-dicarboxylate transport system permease small subunit